jgi:glycosyltransferase involved in cell wall biosynthesis
MKIWFPLVAVDTGSDVYTIRLANSLKRQGIDTEISYFSKYFELNPGLLAGQSPPTGTDIIHSNSWTAFAFKRRDIPLVATVHLPVMDPSYEPYKSFAQKIYHNLLIKRFEQLSLAAADKVVAVSDFVNRSIRNTYNGVEPVTIHNFVDTDQFFPATDKHRVKDDIFRLLFVGNLTKRKGCDLLDPIMEKLGSQYNLKATTGLRKHRFSLSQKNIIAAGKLEGKKLVEAYQNADALLFPTRLEGFGYSALEAMACGIPVIASDNSSIPEVVADGKTGLLCPTNDVDSFYRASKFLHSHPEKCHEYGLAGRERVLSHFSPEQITQQYIALYNDLLS